MHKHLGIGRTTKITNQLEFKIRLGANRLCRIIITHSLGNYRGNELTRLETYSGFLILACTFCI